jgi:hypothetical protein
VIFIDACEGNLPAGAGWFCPNARFLPESGMTARNVVDIRQLAKRATVPTSHGETDLYSCDSPETASPAPGSISAVLCSFGDVDVLVSPNGQQVNISMDEIHLCLNLQTRTIQALP